MRETKNASSVSQPNGGPWQGTQARDQRRKDIKIDCPDMIEWRRWVPGHEYRKTFKARNLATRVQTLRWQPPETPYFSVGQRFEEPHATLRPGMTASIVMVFRPATLVNHECTVNFKTARGTFPLILRGSLPAINLGIPSFLYFGYCAVNDVAEKSFEIQNPVDFPVTYDWTVQLPFSIVPASSTLLPGKRGAVFCRFQPNKASVYSTTAVCSTYTGVPASELKLEGVGKYSFLTLSSTRIEFGEVLVRTSKEIALSVANISAIPANFTVKIVKNAYEEAEHLFFLNPTQGVIPPNSTFIFKVVYNPVCAGTFSTKSFEIQTSQECRASFTCTGTAGRPAVKLSTLSLNFGSLEEGTSIRRAVVLANTSAVPIAYQFMMDDDKLFDIVQPRGICRPKRSVKVIINFRPNETSNYYKRVICIMQDQHPLYCDLIGNCYKKTLKSPTLKQFHIDQHRRILQNADVEREVLDLQRNIHNPTRESILANFEANIPAKQAHLLLTGLLNNLPGITWKSEFARGKGAWNAMLVASMNKNMYALERFDMRLLSTANQGTGMPQEKSSALAITVPASEFQKSGEGTDRPVGSQYIQANEMILLKEHHDGTEQGTSLLEVWDEYFLGRMTYWEPVTIDCKHIDFGLCICMQLSEPRYIHVFNNTDATVHCLWLVRQENDTNEVIGSKKRPSTIRRFPRDEKTKQNERNFHVVPDRAVITVNTSYTFSVIFEPKQANCYYYQRLSIFVWTHSNDRVLPPWSTVVEVFGHTFQKGSQVFLPQVTISSLNVVFPPVLQGLSVFRSISINNNGNTPLRFQFKSDDLQAEFSVRPEYGLIQANDFQLVTFRFDAGEPKTITNTVNCILNHSPTEEMIISLTASSHTPKLKFEKNGSISFKPTVVGTKAVQSIKICNVGLMPAGFYWNIPEKLSKVIKVDPLNGTIQSGDEVKIYVSFIPDTPRRYYCPISCRVFAHIEKAYVTDNKMATEQVTGREIDSIPLIVNGEATEDSIEIEPHLVEYGSIIAGYPNKTCVTLHNHSAGSVEYSLECQSTGLFSDSEMYNFESDPPYGLIHGNSMKLVMLTFHPKQAGSFQLELICHSYCPDQPKTSESPYHSMTSCYISAEAMYPFLLITAARTEGLSCLQLWRDLQIYKLNKRLAEDKLNTNSEGQVIYEDLFCVGVPCQQHQNCFTLQVGAKAVSVEPSVIDLVFRSGCELPVAWRMRLWNDRDVDIEHWAGSGVPTDEENSLLRIRKKNLFYAEPRKGYMHPGEEMFVRIRYAHILEGTHILPAVLEVQNGRTVHLQLSGQSLPTPPRLLVMERETHHLKPMKLGQMRPPLQTFELCNKGTVEVKFNIDMAPLEDLIKKNYGFRVLWCINPSGTIPPMESVLLNYIFQPIEAKEYFVDIPIWIEGGQCRTIHLQGRGIDPRNKEDIVDETNNTPPSFGQSYNWPDLPAMLSSEIIDFQKVLGLSHTHRLIVVQNLLSDLPIKFDWKLNTATEMVYGLFTVTPSDGLVGPGQQCTCKVGFTAGTHPQVLETRLCCQVQSLPEDYASPGEHISETLDSSSEEADPVNILIDTWPKRLGMGLYDKFFQHQSVIESNTRSKLTKFTGLALQKLGILEKTLHLRRLEKEEQEALAADTPPPTVCMLYLTVRADINVKEFTTNSEDLVAIKERLPWKSSGRDPVDLQEDLAFEIFLEILQESWHIIENKGFLDSLDAKQNLYFERFNCNNIS